MKSLFTAIAILLVVTAFGQNRTIALTKNVVIGEPVLSVGGNYNFVYNGDLLTSESHQIILGSKKKPMATPTTKYTFRLNGYTQAQRNSDTLTIHDKTIRFIVVDGVTYEIVRTTTIQEASPVRLINTRDNLFIPYGQLNLRTN